MEGQKLPGMDQRLQIVPNLGASFILVPSFAVFQVCWYSFCNNSFECLKG